jgi:3-oxoadipate enol-lactonase/4-carboxymuconolactone decarboxylase
VTAPVAVHHLVEGPEQAPVLVLSGSLGSTLEMWDPQMAALTQHFRVVRYDLRGHGRSPVPPGPYEIADLGADLIALLDRLGVARAHLCGLSLGGMLSLWTAAHHPERVDRLVVCCTSALLGPPEMWIERAAAVATRGTGAVADIVLSRWFTPALHRRDAALVARMRAMLFATPAAGYAACCGAIQRMDLRADLAAIRAPTLAIAGAEDPSTPPAHLSRIADAIAGCHLVVVDGAAHLVNVEQPEWTTTLILSHLQDRRLQDQTSWQGQRWPKGRASMSDSPRDIGMRIRREVLGDAHVDRAIAQTTPFTADFQDFITRVAWGDVWARPDLDRRTRSCVTLAILTALGREAEIAAHVRAALRNGLTPAEIAEVLLHTAVYAGVPAANRAFAIAQGVLDEIAAGGAAPATEPPPGKR